VCLFYSVNLSFYFLWSVFIDMFLLHHVRKNSVWMMCKSHLQLVGLPPCLLSSRYLFRSPVHLSSLLLDSPPLKPKETHIKTCTWEKYAKISISVNVNILCFEQYQIIEFSMHHGLILTNSVCPTSSWIHTVRSWVIMFY